MDGLPSTLFWGFIGGSLVITFFVILFGLGRRVNWKDELITDDPNDQELLDGSPRYPGL